MYNSTINLSDTLHKADTLIKLFQYLAAMTSQNGTIYTLHTHSHVCTHMHTHTCTHTHAQSAQIAMGRQPPRCPLAVLYCNLQGKHYS